MRACRAGPRRAARANATVVHTAVADAQGPRVERLSHRFGRLQDQAHTVEAHLRHAAAVLRAASERARADQTARLDARQRWQAEADVERLLEAVVHARTGLGAAPLVVHEDVARAIG